MNNSSSNGIEERVLKDLEKYNLTPIVMEEGSTKTAQMAAETLDVEVGQIAKSILVNPETKEGEERKFAMIVISGDKKLSSKKLKDYFESKTNFANTEDTLRLTGFTFGGVCPFGVTGIQFLVDISLKRYEHSFIAAGSDSSLTKIPYSTLLEICSSKEVDLSA